MVRRNAGPPVRIVSAEAGVSLAAPKGWSVEVRHPTDPEDANFIQGHERAAFDALQRGGFWVARWSVPADTTIASLKRTMLASRAEQRRDATISDGIVAGRQAAVLRYTKPTKGFSKLRLGGITVTERRFVVNGFAYLVGTYTAPHAGSVARQLDALVDSIELHAPAPWTGRVAGASLRLPGGWIESPTTLPGAGLFALAPGNPSDAWAYVFHYDGPPADSVAAAKRNIPKNGGVILSEEPAELGGRAATKLTFNFNDAPHPQAQGVEWFISDGHGKTFVLAVGRRAGDEHVAETIASGWRY